MALQFTSFLYLLFRVATRSCGDAFSSSLGQDAHTAMSGMFGPLGGSIRNNLGTCLGPWKPKVTGSCSLDQVLGDHFMIDSEEIEL